MRIRKLLPYFFLFGIIFLLLACIHFLKKETISNEKQCKVVVSSDCWGYKVETFPTRHFSTITIWHSWRINQAFSFPTYIVTPTVNEQRWLANGTAFYLYLDNVNTDDSFLQKQKIRIIYDFESGQMYAERYSAHWLNSTLDSRINKNLDLSEDEFEAILLKLEKIK